MKTKNMRKKALLSSVAMLLVAIVALSGATYAWFTANNTVNVKGINLTTEKSSNLLVCDTEGGDYSSDLTVDWAATQLVPCSGCDGNVIGSFYTVTAKEGALVTEDEADTYVQKVEASGASYVSKTIYFKSGVNAHLKLTGITGAGDLANALRVGIAVDGGNLVIYSVGDGDVGTCDCIKTGISAVPSGKTVQYKDLYDKSTGKAADAGIAFGSYTVSALTTAITDKPVTALATPVSVYIWLEGNDTDCVNSISGESGNLTLTFSSTPVSA